MKLNVCLLLFFGLAISEAKINSSCPHNRTLEADQCAKKVLLIFNPDWEGHRGDNVDYYCESTKSSLSCVGKFINDCLRGETRNAANVNLNGIRRHHKRFCAPNTKQKQKFFESTKWIKKKEMDVLYPCIQASIINIIAVPSQVKDPKKRLPQCCCNFDLTEECLTEKMVKLTTEANILFIQQMLDTSMRPLFDFLCPDNFQESCERDMPDAMKRMKAIFKNPSPRPKAESFLIPFIDVLDSL